MRRALATLAALHAADAAFECVRDAHGCCSSAGYFFCGSSGRCVGRDDPCEDGSGAAAATCGATLKRDGAVASWDLKGLTRTSSLLDYEARDGASKVIFNVCANANPPRVCADPEPAAAYAISKQSCKAVAGSAADADMASLKPLVGADPTQGVALAYSGPDRCSFLLRVRCAEGAVEPSEPTLISSADCATITEVESVHGCPLGCARDRQGAACSNRGQCVWEKTGAACRCDPGTTGAACDEDINGGPAARARWRFAIIVLVVSLCAAVVAARCVAFRKRRLATLRARGTYATVDADDDADGVELGASMPFDPFPYEDDAVEEFDAPPGTGGRRDE